MPCSQRFGSDETGRQAPNPQPRHRCYRVEKYAQDKRIPFSNYKSLCESEPIIELIGEEVDRANAGFSPVEQVKKFRLIDVLLTAEDEELTPTMKLKRNEVERKYKDLIETMY